MPYRPARSICWPSTWAGGPGRSGSPVFPDPPPLPPAPVVTTLLLPCPPPPQPPASGPASMTVKPSNARDALMTRPSLPVVRAGPHGQDRPVRRQQRLVDGQHDRLHVARLVVVE